MAKSLASQAFSLGGLTPLQILRLLVQLAVVVVLHGKLFGLVSSNVIVPYLHPSQAPFSTAAGAYEVMEYTIGQGTFPLLALGVLYATAVLVGRVFCGWACPFGMLQDVLSYLPFKKEKMSESTASTLKDVRRGVFAFSLLFAVLVGFRRASSPLEQPLGIFSDAPFSVVDPSSTLFAYLPWTFVWKSQVLSTAGLFGWIKLLLLAGVLVPSAWYPRFFCRYVCPVSTLSEPVASVRMLSIARTGDVTAANSLLSDVCPMGVQVVEGDKVITSADCIHCGKCVEHGPQYFSQVFA